MNMSIEKFLLRSEDEMDFLPIIPLNESDQEDINSIIVPEEIGFVTTEEHRLISRCGIANHRRKR